MQAQDPSKQVAFYKQPWFKIAVPVVTVIGIYIALHWNQPDETFAGWLVDLLAVGMSFVLTLGLASQFVLPVRTYKERLGVIERMFLYASGGHGPIVFVRDGKILGNEEELSRKGEGVVLVDGFSAVVLEKKGKFSRAVGPGIVYTTDKEKITAAFDLRKQSRSQETAALTKDGIEIKANIGVTFSLEGSGDIKPTPIADDDDMLGNAKIAPMTGFNPDSAFKAVYGFVMDKDNKAVSWIDLPVVVATEFFRDQVSRYTLDEIFKSREAEPALLGLIQTRATSEVQNAVLLKDRGTKIWNVTVGMQDPPEEITNQRVRTWSARWRAEAVSEKGKGDFEVERIKEEARAQARRELVDSFRKYQLAAAGTTSPTNIRRIIAEKITEDVNRVGSDPVMSMMLGNDTMKLVTSVRQWAGVAEPPPKALPPQASPSEDLSELNKGDTGPLDDSDLLDDDPGSGS
jgi:regulator of protease activity HflC (stomatin/prohibitin superfamily)